MTTPISVLHFHPTDTAGAPFEIGRLETSHQLRTSTHPHRHSYHQILWVTAGAGAHAVDFEEVVIRPPSVFLISPGQVHATRVDEPFSGYMLLFTADFLPSDGLVAADPANATSAGLPFFRPGLPNPVLTLTPEEATHLRPIAEDLLAEFVSRAPWRAEMLRARFQTFLLALGRIAHSGCQDLPLPSPASAVGRLQALIDAHFRRLHRVADYANLLGLTPGHLSHLAKAATGQTAGALIDARLTLEAKRLLAHSDATAAEIADSLGFHDPAYFGRFFRRHTQQSPGAFRAAIREKYQRNR